MEDLIEIKAGKFEGKLRLQIKDNGSGEEAGIINLKKMKKMKAPERDW